MYLSRVFWIGFIFIISAIIFTSGLLYIQDISIRKSNYTFTVLFDNVQGLNVGDQVNMLGKRIGKVSGTRIIGQEIAVELSIDNNFAFSIPIDSQIEVKSEGLIGSKYVAINPGISTKEYIIPGETVQGIREYDFTEITPDIVPMTRDLSAFARRLKATLGEEQKDQIRNVIYNIESFTANLDTFSNSIHEVLSSDDKENIRSFLLNMKMTSDELKTGISKDIKMLNSIVSDLNKLTSKSDDMVDIVNKLNISTSKLDNILTKVESGNGTISQLINTDTIHDNVNGLVSDMRSLIADFKENPTRYAKAYWKGKK